MEYELVGSLFNADLAAFSLHEIPT